MTMRVKKRQGAVWATFGVLASLFGVTSVYFVFFPRIEIFENPLPELNIPVKEYTTQDTASSTSTTTPPLNISLTNNIDPAVDSLPQLSFIEVTRGCDMHFGGECLLVRSGPGSEFSVVDKLRNSQVLRVTDTITKDATTWYKVIFDEWLLYPERVTGDWYVAADYVELFKDVGTLTTWDNSYATDTIKKIIVDRTKQTLRAYDGEILFMEVPVSTGLKTTPTPSGTFEVFKKMPSRYMQGPLPNVMGNQYYDLPGVPWNLYFTQDGAVIHGAYWHDSFGTRYSHGCVNLKPEDAKKLYQWADLGTLVAIIN